MNLPRIDTDPKLDLVLERVIDVRPALVWKAWTEPEQICKWFCPKPWWVSECQVDLRPGGQFRTVMRSPEGEAFPNVGCYLEVVPERRLVWTDGLHAGWRPAATPVPGAGLPGFFTGFIDIEAHGAGSRYTAIVKHGDEITCKKHADMGFHDGWAAALAQLVELAKTW
jgi:uncharacterized protein YndB with AHSA1/START domain